MVSTMTTTTTTTASPIKKDSCFGKNDKHKDRHKCLEADQCVSNCVGYGRVCPLSARRAGRAACDAIQKLSHESQVFPPNPCDQLKSVATWNVDDLEIGKKLGQGGFSEVHEVVVLRKQDEKNGTKGSASAESAKTTDKEQEGDDGCYAIKYLQRKVMVHPKAFELGASDLAVEAYFLASLKHKHIVQIFAMTAGDVETNLRTGREGCFFIVIDRLYDTLEQRIEKWKKELDDKGAASTNVRRPLRLSVDKSALSQQQLHLQTALVGRLGVALDICSAMQYLHGLNIIFRDLKPDNIGFDRNGVVKIFDFGLAKEMRESDRLEKGTYKLTGKTGSRRYMAPEVAMEQPYNSSVDVYSFAILTWEMCALEKPFLGYSAGKHQKQVVLGHERPKMTPNSNAYCCWSWGLQFLLQQSWSRHPNQRPNFEKIQQELKDVVSAIESNKKDLSPPERSRGTSNPESPPPKFAAMKRPTKQGRARTWGFPARKQQQVSEDP